ncbi:hypothetical protein LS68_000040 [Helicobacter sp. MIT 05-5293]|uniref:hypothetical protein n=1 Tax=Helicobacter sp. MIT 05-5293 TaxID=1548149 RepID=UPI00051DB88F|nr:hypothetical protein [Helicobacter sp. MIT 05-5293]TLD81472.1 hypothetical protein LS68_000040 [Helicobacter sp. MIT 05-5293]
MKKYLYILIVLLGTSLNVLQADDFEEIQTLGVQKDEIIINSDTKEITRIISIGEANYHFGDAKDIRQATHKAELSAKAYITKYLSEDIKSQETQEQLSKTLSEQSSKGNANVSKKDIDTLMQNISNDAQAILKGVVTIQTLINKKDKVVRVVVGWNRNQTSKKKPSKKYEDF